MDNGRSINLAGATGIGVGAIVGGGILALSGVAFQTTGPGAIVAFAMNGLIAVLTALSFAEMSTAFPDSGGTYTFAKKILTVEAAFAVGWIVWFASIVAGMLYALGFASFAVSFVTRLCEEGGWTAAPAWLETRPTELFLAAAATLFYAFGLVRRRAGGNQWATIGKVVVFAVLIAGGLSALAGRPESMRQLRPMFPHGMHGIVQAMGYTFIALQGFDLVAAVAGEIRDPERVIPRAMLLSLGIALAVYLPFLTILATVGTPAGSSITELSTRYEETVVAVAAQNYLGATGYWLVIVAGLLSMLSALQANLLAASRVAMTMARDRTLPRSLGRLSDRGTPAAAIVASAGTLLLLLLMIPDVAAAGAASSLIFLICFALAHGLTILARRRAPERAGPFRVPFFPLVPAVGVTACAALALFQGVAVPSAGWVAAVWLISGGALYLSLFARRARVFDASAEASDPDLIRLRGRSPLVLVPIANPASAEAMVGVANALATPRVGRVVLLSIVRSPEVWEKETPPPELVNVQEVLRQALTASFAAGLGAEALTTVARQPWHEINRVARTYRCECLLVGIGSLDSEAARGPVEELMSNLTCDVAVLRAAPGWQLGKTSRVLIPIGGGGGQDVLRARLLGALCRIGTRELTFLRVLPGSASPESVSAEQRRLSRLATDEAPVTPRIEVLRSDAPAREVGSRAAEADLVILGTQRLHRRRKVFGEVVQEIARNTDRTMILISRRG